MRPIRTLLLASAIWASALAVPGADPARSQELQRIAAVVNDEVVSVRDLRNRIRLVIVTSGLQANNETARRLAPQVLRTLIDEQLQLQEAERLSIAVSDQEMTRARADLEARNGLRPGEFDRFVTRLGVDPGSVKRQLRASIAWAKLVRRRFSGQVSVSQEEVAEILTLLEEQIGKSQKRVSEILLTVEDPAREAEAAQLAARLTQQLRQGASFGSIARQFSNASNANVGGDIGWVLDDQLAPDLAAAVANLDKGEISEPIRSVFGYHIMRVTDTRVLAEPNPLDAKVRLNQLFLPVRSGTGSNQRASQRELAETIRTAAGSCEDLADFAQQAGSPVSPDLGEMQVRDLAPDLRDPVATLQTGQTSEPIDLPNGVMVIMVCDRQSAASNLPSADQIRAQLEAQRFGVLAQRYLRDLRQTAFVETRV